eukprot:g39504.t1
MVGGFHSSEFGSLFGHWSGSRSLSLLLNMGKIFPYLGCSSISVVETEFLYSSHGNESQIEDLEAPVLLGGTRKKPKTPVFSTSGTPIGLRWWHFCPILSPAAEFSGLGRLQLVDQVFRSWTCQRI